MNRPFALGAAAAVLAAFPATASAGATITGTDGRDEVQITGSGDKRVLITGAANVVGDGCFNLTDTLVGRTTAVNCGAAGAWSISLGAGDDVLDLRLGFSDLFNTSVTADGGPGADLLQVDHPFARTLRGGDGDDTLVAPPASFNSEPGVAFDGGAGRDTVDFKGAGGVSASIPGKSATVRLFPQARDATTGQPAGAVRTRTDSLEAIERLSGSTHGDILTGGPGPDELLGGDGPDNLSGGDGADVLDGGGAVDELDGGNGPDLINGGPAPDSYRKGSGGDTITSRDGFVEDIACVKADTIVSDLVDRLTNPAECGSVSVAAAKHAWDTRLVALRAGPRAVIECPELKTERCSGRLMLRAGGDRGRVLARARYDVRQGARKTIALRVSMLPAGRAATLQAAETDVDKRPRSILKRVQLRR